MAVPRIWELGPRRINEEYQTIRVDHQLEEHFPRARIISSLPIQYSDPYLDPREWRLAANKVVNSTLELQVATGPAANKVVDPRTVPM